MLLSRGGVEGQLAVKLNAYSGALVKTGNGAAIPVFRGQVTKVAIDVRTNGSRHAVLYCLAMRVRLLSIFGLNPNPVVANSNETKGR